MRLSELIPFLNELGTEPKKRLSQNFLIDANIVKKIVATAQISSSDVVLEIGPGPGALTAELLNQGATVIAIEKDPLFARALERLQTEDRRLTVYEADALDFDFQQIEFQKVVANLPYHITTPLIERFFERPFVSLTLMVQKEFADRVFAKEGTKEFGSLSLFTQFHATLFSRFFVSSRCFYPKPSVDSSVIHLTKKDPPANVSPLFFTLIRKAFQQRRKTLSRALEEALAKEQTKQILASIGIREDARAEILSLKEWILFLKKALPGIVQENGNSCRDHQTTC